MWYVYLLIAQMHMMEEAHVRPVVMAIWNLLGQHITQDLPCRSILGLYIQTKISNLKTKCIVISELHGTGEVNFPLGSLILKPTGSISELHGTTLRIVMKTPRLCH